MEWNGMIRRLAVWVSNAILMVINLYLYLENPLRVQCNLILVILIWSVLCLIVDYLFRNNNVYGVIKHIVRFLICIAFYLIASICESLLFN